MVSSYIGEWNWWEGRGGIISLDKSHAFPLLLGNNSMWDLHHLDTEVKSQLLGSNVGPSLLCAISQDAVECKVQQVAGSVVYHAG